MQEPPVFQIELRPLDTKTTKIEFWRLNKFLLKKTENEVTNETVKGKEFQKASVKLFLKRQYGYYLYQV